MGHIKAALRKRVLDSYTNLTSGKLYSKINIINLMETFHADEFGHRASITNSDLGYGWLHYAMVRANKPKNILCIGSRHGYIPAVLAQACKDNGTGDVVFVDAGYDTGDINNWTGVGYWKTEEGKKCFQEFGLKKYINLQLTTTKNFFKKNRKKYDYIYIDGDHSYSGVRFDYINSRKILNNGGFIVFHDIDVMGKKKEGLYGVHNLWNEISGKNAIKFKFPGSGLGIIQKD